MKFLKSFLEVINHPSNNNVVLTVSRIFWWKINQLFFKIPVVINFTRGVKIICYPDSSYGSQIIYTKFPEYNEMNLLKKYLTKSSNFIDIGAGFGDYSLLAASVIKSGKIFSFEPLEEERVRFIDNVNLNSLERIINLSSSAVSNKVGKIEFIVSDINELSHISFVKEQTGLKSIKSTTIDSIISKNKLKRVSCVKIDVEGAEFLVLKGAKKSLKKGIVDFFITEFNENQKTFSKNSSNMLFKLVKSNNYLVFTIVNKKLIPLDNYDYSRTKNVLIVKNNSLIINKIQKCIK